MKIFVVLREENDYDQHGQYFVAAYSTYEKALASVDHVGRVLWEDTWFEIEEYELDSGRYDEE